MANDLIEHYNSKKIAELKSIEPKWAYGSNSGKILDPTLWLGSQRYAIYIAEIKELVLNAVFAEVDTENLFTADYRNNIRTAKILQRWDNGEFIDPPTIMLCTYDRTKLAFYDGRHRTKTALLLGAQQIPVAIDKADFSIIKNIINLTGS